MDWVERTGGGLLRAIRGGKDDKPLPPTKLETFLSTFVLYPAFYVLATAPPSSSGKRPRRFVRPVAESARKLVSGPEQSPEAAAAGRGLALAPEVHAEFTGFPEARALVALERWCLEPVSLHPLTTFGVRMRDYIEGLQAWQNKQISGNKQTYVQAGVHQLLGLSSTALASVLPSPPPELTLTDIVILKQQELNKEVEPPKLPSSSKASVAGRGELPIAELPATMQQVPSEQQAARQAAVKDANPIAEVAQAIAPNVHFIQATVQAPVSLTRGRTWFEFLQVLLGWVRLWLFWLAYLFFWGATLLRLVGNGLSALGGLFAFTVVVSVVLSVLSALVFLSASGADAVGSVIIYLAKFTEIAQTKSAAARKMSVADMQEQEEFSKLGPRALPPSSFEQLDDFLMRQLASSRVRQPKRQASGFATPIHALRSRPDVPRLAHDPLLVRCYDLQLIDATGNLFSDIGPEEVIMHFDRSGFFAYSSKATRKVAAIMLLRLLAWRRVVGIVSPHTPTAETEEALCYVFVSGLAGAGAGSVYQLLTGMPIDSTKVSCHHSGVEIRAIMHHSSAFAVLACPRLDDKQGQGELLPKHNWITDLSHGIVSCLIFTLTIDSLEQWGSALSTPGAQAKTAGMGAGQQTDQSSGAPGPGAVQVTAGGGEQGRNQQDLQQQSECAFSTKLSQVWQAMEQHRPVLLLILKSAATGEEQAQENEALEHVREASRDWTGLLVEEANRRGLDPNDLTVAPAALSDQPPLGISGFAQINTWVSYALTNARQQR